MRLIDADEFFKNYPELDIEPYNNAPTIEERPHGKWIKQEWGYSCSVCGVSNDYAYDNNIHKFTDYFCPNCGAKMDGGVDDGKVD